MAGLASAEVLAKAAAPRLPAGQVQMLLMLANRDKKLLEQLGSSEQVAVPVCAADGGTRGQPTGLTRRAPPGALFSHLAARILSAAHIS